MEFLDNLIILFINNNTLNEADSGLCLQVRCIEWSRIYKF